MQPESAIRGCVCVCVCVYPLPHEPPSHPCETEIHLMYSNYKHMFALVQLQSMSHVTLLKSRPDHGPPLRCCLWTRIKFSTWPQRASMMTHCFVYNHLPHYSWLCSEDLMDATLKADSFKSTCSFGLDFSKHQNLKQILLFLSLKRQIISSYFWVLF